MRNDFYDPWAPYYDLLEGDRSAFVAFYGGLVTPQTRAVLELGCGTGVVASAIAARSRLDRVVGLDASPDMLEVARRRDPAVTWICGDMRAPDPMPPFGLIYACHITLQHCLTDDDLARVFASARALLDVGGRFAFDIYQPNYAYVGVPVRGSIVRDMRRADGSSVRVEENADYDARTRVYDLEWTLIERSAAGEDRILARTHFPWRQFDAALVATLLERAGLAMLERFGDLDRSAFASASRKQVVVCGRAD